MNESATPPAPIIQTKAELRRQALHARRAVHAAEGAAAALRLAGHLGTLIPAATGKTIAGYWPLGDEIDPRPAMDALRAAGAQIVLPVTGSRYDVLVFRLWEPGQALDTGPFGTQHPPQRSDAMVPDILLVPLIAFDAVGHRLGYGAGYYDRTLTALRREGSVLAIGVAYDAQQVPVVPPDPHDEMLDGIVTDRRAFMFPRAAGA